MARKRWICVDRFNELKVFLVGDVFYNYFKGVFWTSLNKGIHVGSNERQILRTTLFDKGKNIRGHEESLGGDWERVEISEYNLHTYQFNNDSNSVNGVLPRILNGCGNNQVMALSQQSCCLRGQSGSFIWRIKGKKKEALVSCVHNVYAVQRYRCLLIFNVNWWIENVDSFVGFLNFY